MKRLLIRIKQEPAEAAARKRQGAESCVSGLRLRWYCRPLRLNTPYEWRYLMVGHPRISCRYRRSLGEITGCDRLGGRGPIILFVGKGV